MRSGMMLSVPSGQCQPCASVLPTGIMTVSIFPASSEKRLLVRFWTYMGASVVPGVSAVLEGDYIR